MTSPRRKKARPSRRIEKIEFTTNSPLHMTDEEWEKLSKLRIFESGEEGTARQKIDNLLLAFEIAEVERRNEPFYKKKLQAMAKLGKKLDKELSNMQETVLERVVKSQNTTRIIKHHYDALPSRDYLQKIREINSLFQAEVETAHSKLSNNLPGPNTEAIHYLVQLLNGVVLEHSKGGPLTRSQINKKGKGNDVQFVIAVLKMASERSKSAIDASMAFQAIKRLKKSAKDLASVDNVGFIIDIPADDLDHQDSKWLLQSGLAIARKLRSRF